jgi:hypothetical protein
VSRKRGTSDSPRDARKNPQCLLRVKSSLVNNRRTNQISRFSEINSVAICSVYFLEINHPLFNALKNKVTFSFNKNIFQADNVIASRPVISISRARMFLFFFFSRTALIRASCDTISVYIHKSLPLCVTAASENFIFIRAMTMKVFPAFARLHGR